MKKYRINYIVLLFIIFSEMGSSAKLKPGDKAPPFSLIKLENQEYVKSEDYLGKKNLVICFFSSWSRSFNNRFFQLINISEKYDKNTEVVFIAVKEKKPLKKNILLSEVSQFRLLRISLEERLKNSMENYTIISSHL